MQMAKGIDTVPITRDYMFQWENDHYLPAQQLVNEIPAVFHDRHGCLQT
jgi:DNA-binding XRE family transcriptional regulator